MLIETVLATDFARADRFLKTGATGCKMIARHHRMVEVINDGAAIAELSRASEMRVRDKRSTHKVAPLKELA